MEEKLSVVKSVMKVRTGIESYLPSDIIKELKKNANIYNITIISDEGSHQYCFSFCDNNEIRTFQYPAQINSVNSSLDTESLLAFAYLCYQAIKKQPLYDKDSHYAIYDLFMDGILHTLQINGVKTETGRDIRYNEGRF